MQDYYTRRAKEYEKIYDKPERQNDLKRVTEILQEVFKGKEVLEIACGTGYWTQRIAATAKSIFATDNNEAVLKIAKAKTFVKPNVTFEKQDMYHLKLKQKYDSLFGGFIWSHIYTNELHDFLEALHFKIGESGEIVFIDNLFVPGSSTPVHHTDADGNTFQERVLESGEKFMMIKNFPTEKAIREALFSKAKNIRYIVLDYFWILHYNVL